MPLNKLMVLTDFTKASTVAMEHCYQLARLNQAEIISLHVVKHQADLEWAEAKTEKQLKEARNYDEAIVFKAMASRISLYKDIKTLIDKQSVQLTFMATHGKKDVQFITGSDALKVIYNAETPILVIQRDTPLSPYKRIVMTMLGSQAEMDFSIKTLLSIARLYKSAVTFLYPNFKSDKDLMNLLLSMDPIKDIFESHGLKFKMKAANYPASKFGKAIMQEVEEENIDLIVLSLGLKDGKTEANKHKSLAQAMLTNEKNLPVLLF